MTIVIFGGAGFIGRYLAHALVERGHTVVVADNLSIRPEEELPRGALLTKMNVCSVSQVRNVLSCEPDVIYFFAAKQGYHRDWSKYAKTNVMSAYVLFEAIRKIRSYRPERIILASSQAVYAPGRRCDEAAPRHPLSVYGQTKLQQEQAFEFFARMQKMWVIALRYSIVLGAGQSLQSSESGVLRNWIREVVSGKAPKVYGGGQQVRDFVHVKDVTAANFAALSVPLPSHPYGLLAVNVGGHESSIVGLAECFNEVAGGPEPLVLLRPVRPGGEYTLTSSSAFAEDFLCWDPALGIGSMVADFVNFAKKRLVHRLASVQNEES